MNQQSPVNFEPWLAAIVSGVPSAWQQILQNVEKLEQDASFIGTFIIFILIILVLLSVSLILFYHYRTQRCQAAAHIEKLSRDLERRNTYVRMITDQFNELLARRELDNSNLQRSLDKELARKGSELANKDQLIAAHYCALKDYFKAQLSVGGSLNVQERLQASVAKVGDISADAADFLRVAFQTIDVETSNRLNAANEKLTSRENSIQELRFQFEDVQAKLEQTSSSLQKTARDHREVEGQRDKAERDLQSLHVQQDLEAEEREAELQELREEIKLLRSSKGLGERTKGPSDQTGEQFGQHLHELAVSNIGFEEVGNICEIEHQRYSQVVKEVRSCRQSLETESLDQARGLGKSSYLEDQVAHENLGSSTGSDFRIAQGNDKQQRLRQAPRAWKELHDGDRVAGSVPSENGQIRAERSEASYDCQDVEEPRPGENGLYQSRQRHFFFPDRSNEAAQRNESSSGPSDLYQKYKKLCRNTIVEQLACSSPVKQLTPLADAESGRQVAGEFNSGQMNQALVVNDVTLREQSVVQSRLLEDLAAPSGPPPTMTPYSTSTAALLEAKDCHGNQQTDLSLLAQGQSHQLGNAIASPVQLIEVPATEPETPNKFIQEPLQIEPMPVISLQRYDPPAIGVESSAMDLDEPEQQPASKPNSPRGRSTPFSLRGEAIPAPVPSPFSTALIEIGEEMMLERSVPVDASNLEDVLNTLPPDDDDQPSASDAGEMILERSVPVDASNLEDVLNTFPPDDDDQSSASDVGNMDVDRQAGDPMETKMQDTPLPPSVLAPPRPTMHSIRTASDHAAEPNPGVAGRLNPLLAASSASRATGDAQALGRGAVPSSRARPQSAVQPRTLTSRQPGPSRLREVETVEAVSEGRKPKRSGPVAFTIS